MSNSLTQGRQASATRPRRSPWLAARVWLHRGSLKRALAAGAEPSSSPDLTRRAGQLTSPRHRRKLAAGLNRTLREAEQSRAPFTAAVPLRRREILDARAEIERLARDLLAPGEVQARGVVLVQNLLTDGLSPFFTPAREGELERSVRHAHAALLLR
jgi:hypothetical protein